VSSPPLRVVLTGSECTGKTTLAQALAERFATTWSPEFVRAYLEGLGRPLVLGDVPLIAEGQVAGEEAAALAARGVVFHDTDLWSTVVYSRHYFGSCPRAVEDMARAGRADLYLLHHPDVPWVTEAFQREGGGHRSLVHEAFVRRLAAIGARVVDVRGSWPERNTTAVDAVQALLAAGKHGG
jgi:NadR type nicotinamide-nucleotide adenylyltransferase